MSTLPSPPFPPSPQPSILRCSSTPQGLPGGANPTFLPLLLAFSLIPQRGWDLQWIKGRGNSGRGHWLGCFPRQGPWKPGWLVQKLSSCIFARAGGVSSRGMPRTSCSPAVPVFLPALGSGRSPHDTESKAAAPPCWEDPGRPVSIITWHRGCTQDTTMRTGWCWRKAILTGIVKGLGFGQSPELPGGSPRMSLHWLR